MKALEKSGAFFVCHHACIALKSLCSQGGAKFPTGGMQIYLRARERF